ncbi:MAG: hypothetical protein DMG57_36890 [Acidobacteria bacterium]|nr:MAG: hypothetical protein DMG57_36890 [Acidobacteriota bacterium]
MASYFRVCVLIILSLVAFQLSKRSVSGAETIGGVVSGFLFDAYSRTIRSLQGVPGAATLGDSLQLNIAISTAAVSSRADYALAVDRDHNNLVLIQRLRDLRSMRVLETGTRKIERIVLSPEGTAAALLYRQYPNTVQVISGLPASPPLLPELSVDALNSEFSAFAVSDDGGHALAAATSSVFLLEAGGSARAVFHANRTSSVAFINQTDGALVTDAGDNKVFSISKISSVAAALVLRDQSSGVAAPVAVRASRDGLSVFVLNSKPAGIVAFEPKTGITKAFPAPLRSPCSTRSAGARSFG